MANGKVFARAIMRGLKKHGPKIAAGIGAGLLVAGGYLLGREVPRYKKEVEEYEKEHGEKMPGKEKAKLAAKHFVAPAALILGGTTATTLSVCESERRLANAITEATVSAVTSKNLIDYKEAAKEVITEEQQEQIQSKLKEHRDTKFGYEAKAPVGPASEGKMWCYDEIFGGKWFQTDVNTIHAAENEIYSRLLSEGAGSSASLNDIYELIGHELTGVADVFGWTLDYENAQKKVCLNVDTKITDGIPVLTICPNVDIIDPERFRIIGYSY